MSELLNSGQGGNRLSKPWVVASGIQFGNAAQLYESKASSLLSETPATIEEIVKSYMDRYSIEIDQERYREAFHSIRMATQYMKHQIKKKHCL